MNGRYYIDERSGCIAVVDRTKEDQDRRGLHSDSCGVVWFESGEPVRETCPTCGANRMAGWKLAESARARAEAVLKELEAANTEDQR